MALSRLAFRLADSLKAVANGKHKMLTCSSIVLSRLLKVVAFYGVLFMNCKKVLKSIINPMFYFALFK